jgi:hypothetical protein
MIRGPLCFRAAVAAGAVALAGAGGCGDSGAPPLLGDDIPEAGAAVDSSERFTASTPTVKSCNLGPDGGVCACADQPLIVDPPNMYFVLDTSGSMNDDNKWTNVQVVIKNLVTSIGPRAKFGAATFPDERSLMECTPGGEVFPPTQGDSPAGTEGPTAIKLLTVLREIGANGGTPTAATLKAITPHLMSLPGKTYAILATDGGPNCNPTSDCDASQCQYNIESDVLGQLFSCTPDGWNCCGADAGGSDSCLDAQPTIDAVAALYAAGIQVFVVGAPGSEPYAQLLNELATAGGTAVPAADGGVPAAGAPLYYAVSTSDTSAFTAALSAVAAKITGTCTLQLDAVPPVPGLVNVFFNEAVLPQGGPDGWTLNGTTVTILGQSCTEILDGSVLDVRVVAGCPTQEQ